MQAGKLTEARKVVRFASERGCANNNARDRWKTVAASACPASAFWHCCRAPQRGTLHSRRPCRHWQPRRDAVSDSSPEPIVPSTSHPEVHHQAGRPRRQHGQGQFRHSRLVYLPRITDPRGNLTFVEGGEHIPFEIRRVYYLYDVPAGAERGGHPHRTLHPIIIPLSGPLVVILHDLRVRRRFPLERPY